MCVILIAHRLDPEHPVLIAANRDEFRARPATAPQVLGESPRFIGGLDPQAGGTWMGATAHGFFAGLTNQRQISPADPARRSRGDLVRGALQRGDRAAVDAWLATLNPADYNPFNLLYGDAGGLRVASAWPGHAALHFEDVPPGLHVLPNDRLNSPAFPKVARARALLADAPPRALFSALRAALSDTEAPDPLPREPDNPLPAAARARLHALRVELPTYGTVSATAVALRPGAVAHYLFAPGPPGDTPFYDCTDLLEP